MAITYLQNVDLSGHQLLNHRLHVSPSAPATVALEGGLYFNSNTGAKRPEWHDGAQWNPIFKSDNNNTALTNVLRDASGNFTANFITATLLGNSNTTTQLLNARNFSITGRATAATVSFNGTANVALNVTDLQVNPSDITLTSGSFIVGNPSNIGTTTSKSSIPLSGFGAAIANISLGGFKITTSANPSDPQDLATKAYVDASSQGLDPKDEVRLASTANIAGTRTGNVFTLSANGAFTLDGIAAALNDRVLLKNQTNGEDNGPYTVTTVGNGSTPAQLTRSADADTSGEVNNGMFVFVNEGSVNQNSGWFLTTQDPITLNTTPLTFVKFSAAGQIEAGDGLIKSGSVMHVVGTSNRILVTADAVDISPLYAGQTSISTVGTITVGDWQGTTIDVSHGGTGRSALTLYGLLSGSGTGSVTMVNPASAGQLVISQSAAHPAFVTMSGDATISAAGALTIAPGAVTVSKLANLAGLSVLGNATNAAAAPAAVTAALDGQVLRRSGTSIGFGALSLASGNAVTGILPSGNGGTGSQYFGVTGLTGLRSYTFKNQDGTVPVIFSSNVGDGSSTTITVTHGLNTRDLVIQLYRNAAPFDTVYADVERTSTTQVVFRFGNAAPTASQYRAVIMGF